MYVYAFAVDADVAAAADDADDDAKRRFGLRKPLVVTNNHLARPAG